MRPGKYLMLIDEYERPSYDKDDADLLLLKLDSDRYMEGGAEGRKLEDKIKGWFDTLSHGEIIVCKNVRMLMMDISKGEPKEMEL